MKQQGKKGSKLWVNHDWQKNKNSHICSHNCGVLWYQIKCIWRRRFKYSVHRPAETLGFKRSMCWIFRTATSDKQRERSLVDIIELHKNKIQMWESYFIKLIISLQLCHQVFLQNVQDKINLLHTLHFQFDRVLW